MKKIFVVILALVAMLSGCDRDADVADDHCPSGQKITKVEPNSPFSKVIKQKDCILKINSDVVGKDGALDYLLIKHYPNPITFLILRDGKYLEVN